MHARWDLKPATNGNIDVMYTDLRTGQSMSCGYIRKGEEVGALGFIAMEGSGEAEFVVHNGLLVCYIAPCYLELHSNTSINMKPARA